MRERSAIVTAAAGPRLLPLISHGRRPRSELELFNAPVSQNPEAEKVSKQIDEELRVRIIYAVSDPWDANTRLQKEADRLKRKKDREVKGAFECVMFSPLSR
jgi:hypothetical protein